MNFSGLAEGFAQGLDKVDQAVNYMEDIKRNRENMRLKWAQEGRQQEAHDAAMQQMQLELEKLRDESDQRKFMDELEGIDNGWRDGFSPELMATNFYKRRFRDFNTRPASFYGKEELAKLGIPEDQASKYYISDNGHERQATLRDVFHQTTGYQMKLNKIKQDEAKTNKAVSEANVVQMTDENLQKLQPAIQETITELSAVAATLPPDQKLKIEGALAKIAQFGTPTAEKPTQLSFNQQDAEKVALYTSEVQAGNFTHLTELQQLAQRGNNQTVHNSIFRGLKKRAEKYGGDLEALFKAEPEMANMMRNAINVGATTQVGKDMAKGITEIVGKGQDLYFDQIAKALQENPNVDKDAAQYLKTKFLSYTPTNWFKDSKAENLSDEQFATMTRLFINAYGNANYGSALTAQELNNIVNVFGSDFTNATTFLKGAIGNLQNTIDRLEQEIKRDPDLGEAMYGHLLKSRRDTLKSLIDAQHRLLNYQTFKKNNPRGTDEDFRKFEQSQQAKEKQKVSLDALADEML